MPFGDNSLNNSGLSQANFREIALFLFGPDSRQKLRRRIAWSAAAKEMAEAILLRSTEMLDEPRISQQYEAGRAVLLPTTRKFADRAQHFVLAWLLTGEARFARSIVDDLMIVTSFSDWNRKHFLDVAEMVSAVAMASQWVAPFLSRDEKRQIDEAILEKGLRPGIDSLNGGSEWTRQAGNWNIVCNSGLMLAALAVSESYPRICAQILTKAQTSLAVGMAAVGPSGEWFEGLTYWSYAAHHAALAQIAVEHTGFRLENPTLFDPILNGGIFAAASVAPSGLAANFGDSMSKPELCPMQAWLSARYGRPLPKKLAGTHPFELIFGDDEIADDTPPRTFIGNHLVALRGRKQAWLAVSVGMATHAHAHHDIGSFLWEIDGARFVVDPGRVDYARKGYFSAERFDHFGASAAAHNLPVFDPVSMLGWRADVEYCRDTGSGLDLMIHSISPMGSPDSTRNFTLSDDNSLLIEDRISPPQGQLGQKLRSWQFHTDAQVELNGDGLFLHKIGQAVKVSAEAIGMGSWEINRIDKKAIGLTDADTVTRVAFTLPESSADIIVVVRFELLNRD